MRKSKAERQKRLISLISSDPALLIRDLADDLDVSRETIRRDLDELSVAGRLHRRYGGATFAPIGQEVNFSNRSVVMVEERKAIARLAASQISDNEVVMLGSGVTSQFFASALVALGTKATVITNSVTAAVTLGKSEHIRTLVAPGEYDDQEGFLWGHETTDFIKKFHADVVVFSVDGLSTAGVMEIDSRTGWILRRMMEVGRRKVLLIDHSKHDQRSLELICSLEDIDVLVTDKPPTGELSADLQKAGVIVNCADVDEKYRNDTDELGA